MAAVDPKVFNQFALKFKNQDPQLYENFLRVLDRYTYELTVAVTEAAPDKVLSAQGRAQQSIKFFQLLSEFRDETGKPVT